MEGANSHAAFPDPLVHPKSLLTSRMMTLVSGQNVIYSDHYFRFGHSLIGMFFPSTATNQKASTLPVSQKKCMHHKGYMPIFNSPKPNYEDYPGILMSDKLNQTVAQKTDNEPQWQAMMPVIRCIVPNSSSEDKYSMFSCDICNKGSHILDENATKNIVYRETRNIFSRISIAGGSNVCASENRHSYVETSSGILKSQIRNDVRGEEGSSTLLYLMSGPSKMKDLRFKKQPEYYQLQEEKVYPKVLTSSIRSSIDKSCSSFSSCTSKDELRKHDPMHRYELLPRQNSSEINDKISDNVNIEENELLDTFSSLTPTTISQCAITPASDASGNIQESSFSSIEPYPLPETPSLLLLEPLLLMQQDIPDGSRKPVAKKRKLTRSEQQKVTRIMIGYTLAFFLLAIVTFYVVYFV